MTSSKSPNFFLIGAPKSGTTSLYNYLKSHPEIYMSERKEPNFFMYFNEEPNNYNYPLHSKKKYQNGLTFYPSKLIFYQKLFSEVKSESIIGEASTGYIWHPHVAERIHKFNSKAKIIAILRDPRDAVFSRYLMGKRRRDIPSRKSFLSILKKEDLDCDNPWNYSLIRNYFYDEHLARYYDLFPEEQICILLYEELKSPKELMNRVFKFLEVSIDFVPDLEMRYNIAPELKSTKSIQNNISIIFSIFDTLPMSFRRRAKFFVPKSVFSLYMKKRLKSPSRQSNRVQPDFRAISSSCPVNERKLLTSIFTPHILRLEKLLGRDLSCWMD